MHELKAGNNVALYDGGELLITNIEIVALTTAVYNFEVEDFHTYYVSEQNVLVHNSSDCDVKPVKKVHGNSTNSQKPTENYTLKDQDGKEYHGVGSLENVLNNQ